MTRKALFVLGMHRSGTSAVTGTLVSRGAAAPKTPLPPSPENPKGYWESKPLVQIHDRILKRAGLSWDSWDTQIDTYLRHVVTDEDRSTLRTIIQSEFEESKQFVLKDPRTALFLPTWQEEAPRMGITLCPVLVLRSPLEVALSLQKRDRFDIDTSVLIWLRYNLLAERWTRHQTRYVFSFNEFLNNSETVLTKLANCFALTWTAISEKSSGLIDPQLRHHRNEDFGTIQNPTLRFLVKVAHRALEDIANNRSNQAAYELDAVSECLDRLLAFNPSLRPQRGIVTNVRKFNRVSGLRGYNLESPPIGSLFHNLVLPVSGWAVPEKAGTLEALELWGNGNLVESAAACNKRSDVAAALPSIPHAEQSGYKFKVKVRKTDMDFSYTLRARIQEENNQYAARTICEIAGKFLPSSVRAGEKSIPPPYSKEEFNRLLAEVKTDEPSSLITDQCLEFSRDLCENDHPLEACSLLEALISKRTPNRTALINLAAVYRRLGQPDKAAELLVPLAKRHPLLLSVKYETASDLLTCGRQTDADDILEVQTPQKKNSVWLKLFGWLRR